MDAHGTAAGRMTGDNMKLASERNGHPDGSLLVVSRDLTLAAPAARIAPNLQHAIDRWDEVLPALTALSDRLNAGQAENAAVFRPEAMTAPLPRAWQWLDGSAFPSHGELMQKAFNLPPILTDFPLMYQGMSHRFLGPTEDVPLPSEQDDIDFEGEFAVITGPVNMGTSARQALDCVRLAVQIDVRRGGARFGDVPSTDMAFGFHELIAHAARTRSLCAGTLIGSGTISTRSCRDVGSCCIAERRAIEMIDLGAPRTSYLGFGERVRMAARIPGRADPLFGVIEQTVVRG